LNDVYTIRRKASADAEEGAFAPFELGALDLCKATHGQTPGEFIDYILKAATACEGYGHSRYWLAEHYTPDAALLCSELLIGFIERSTTQVQIGLCGFLLAYRSVRRAAELAFALVAIAAGQLDFRVCRVPGGAHSTVAAELASSSKDGFSRESFHEKLRGLVPYLLGEPGQFGRASPLLGAVVGDPDCRGEQLLWLSTHHGVTELLVASWVAAAAERLCGYELLATKLLAVATAMGALA